MDETAPGLADRDELHPALAFTHVPEIRLATFKLCLGPRKPDAVMMEMIRRIVVGDELAAGRENGVQVTAALEDRFDVGPRQFAHLRLIMENELIGDGALDLTAFAGHLHAVAETAVRFGRNQSIRPGQTVLQFLFNEARMALAVGLKRNHVPAFVRQLLEVTRAGGPREPDGGITAVVVASKNRDPARAFRGAEAEGKAEEQDRAGGEKFFAQAFLLLEGPFVKCQRGSGVGLQLPSGLIVRRDREFEVENLREWVGGLEPWTNGLKGQRSIAHRLISLILLRFPCVYGWWVGWDSNPRPTA